MAIDLITPGEESTTIIERVRRFLLLSDINNYTLPWHLMTSTDSRVNERNAKIEAIEDHLGIFPNGTFVPLTIRQRMFFGSPVKKLEYKIKKIRSKSREVTEFVNSLETKDEDGKDVALLREFILECLPPFKRYALEVNNHAYDEAEYRRVSWPVYVIAWIFISATLLFFIYWIFAWGVYEGDSMLSTWGAIFGTGAATDIIFIQVTKIVVLNYLPGLAMQHQLVRIRSVLADILANYVNRNMNQNNNALNVDAEENMDEISVVQYMSAACRAARSTELCNLPAAWLLRQVTHSHTIHTLTLTHTNTHARARTHTHKRISVTYFSLSNHFSVFALTSFFLFPVVLFSLFLSSSPYPSRLYTAFLDDLIFTLMHQITTIIHLIILIYVSFLFFLF